MRYFDRNRRRLTRQHYVRGTLKNTSGANEVLIEDSAGLPFRNIDISGNTFQQTYSGKNLFNKSNIDKTRYLSIEKNSFSTDDISIYNCTDYIPVTENTTYVKSGNFGSDGIAFFDVAKSKIGNVISCASNVAFTTPSGCAYMVVNVLVSNAPYDDCQIEKGSTATEYEPYVGGIPSPNPGQTIKQYKTEEKITDLTTILENDTVYTGEYGYMCVFTNPIIPENNTELVTFSVESFFNDYPYSAIMIGMSPEAILTGMGGVDMLAQNGTAMGELTLDPSYYPDGFYIGVGDTSEPIQDKLDEYRQFAIDAHISIRQNVQVKTDPLIIPAYPQEIENANVDGVDIFTTEGATADSYLAWETGAVHSTTYGTSTTDFIEVKPNTTYEFSGKETSYNGWTERRVIGYDENKEFYCVLTGCLMTNNNPWTRRFNTYEGVKYVRISYKPTDENIYLKSIMNMEVHGKNLLSTTGLTRYKTTNILVTENSIYSNNGQSQYNTRIIFSKLYPKGTYTVSYKKLDSGDSVRLLASVQIDQHSSWVLTAQMWQRYISSNPAYDPVTNPKLEKFTFTIDRPFQIGFALLKAGQTNGICDIMLCREKDASYEPYYGEELIIPTSVDVDGMSVPLLFSEYDKLTVDRVSNKVIYTEGSFTKTLTGNESWILNGFATSQGVCVYRINLAYNKESMLKNQGYCNCFARRAWGNPVPTAPNIFFISDDVVLQFELNGTETVDEFKSLLQEKYNSGNPVTLMLHRKTPKEHDVTNTEFGQALLKLCIERGLDGTLSVHSSPQISELKCSYYSQEKEDKVVLVIRYYNVTSDLLISEKTYNIRCGSRYRILSPHIDGYESIEKEVVGVADDNKTITINYKEANDATV